MPFALTTIGALLIVTGFQDTYKAFFTQLEGDFTGTQSFIYWFLSLIIIGAIGYVDEFKTISRAGMTLVIIGMIFANKSAFSNFSSAIEQGSTSPVNAPGDAVQGSSNNGSGGSSAGSTSDSSGDIVGEATDALELASFAL